MQLCSILFVAAIFRSAAAAESASSSSEDEPSVSSSSSYGIDVSFPIFKRVSTNYPWLPHNWNNITSSEKKSRRPKDDMPIQPLGNRQQIYNDYLTTCRAYYGKTDGSKCDVYEYDRMIMNQRQPQSMQNYTKVGFLKTRAPKKVIDLSTQFWEKNHLNTKAEKWPRGNSYINTWVSPTYMISIEDGSLRGGGFKLRKEIWDASREAIQWTTPNYTPIFCLYPPLGHEPRAPSIYTPTPST